MVLFKFIFFSKRARKLKLSVKLSDEAKAVNVSYTNLSNTLEDNNPFQSIELNSISKS